MQKPKNLWILFVMLGAMVAGAVWLSGADVAPGASPAATVNPNGASGVVLETAALLDCAEVTCGVVALLSAGDAVITLREEMGTGGMMMYLVMAGDMRGYLPQDVVRIGDE